MFGNQCRNIDNTENIDENDLAVIANDNLATRVRGLVVKRAAAGGSVGDGAIVEDDDFVGGIVESEHANDA